MTKKITANTTQREKGYRPPHIRKETSYEKAK